MGLYWCRRNPHTWPGVFPRCPLGVRAVEGFLDAWIVCRTGGLVMQCIRCDPSRSVSTPGEAADASPGKPDDVEVDTP